MYNMPPKRTIKRKTPTLPIIFKSNENLDNNLLNTTRDLFTILLYHSLKSPEKKWHRSPKKDKK